jgi:hypothetical protein
VDKLNYLSVTTQKLGARVHTHLSTRLHLCYSIRCVISPRNCIGRVFISKEEWKKFWARWSSPGLNGICVCSWVNKTCMGLKGKTLTLHRKKVFGTTCCVEKILPRILSSVIYMLIRHQFFYGN